MIANRFQDTCRRNTHDIACMFPSEHEFQASLMPLARCLCTRDRYVNEDKFLSPTNILVSRIREEREQLRCNFQLEWHGRGSDSSKCGQRMSKFGSSLIREALPIFK